MTPNRTSKKEEEDDSFGADEDSYSVSEHDGRLNIPETSQNHRATIATLKSQLSTRSDVIQGLEDEKLLDINDLPYVDKIEPRLRPDWLDIVKKELDQN